jgi:hypothetical protein
MSYNILKGDVYLFDTLVDGETLTKDNMNKLLKILGLDGWYVTSGSLSYTSILSITMFNENDHDLYYKEFQCNNEVEGFSKLLNSLLNETDIGVENES